MRRRRALMVAAVPVLGALGFLGVRVLADDSRTDDPAKVAATAARWVDDFEAGRGDPVVVGFHAAVGHGAVVTAEAGLAVVEGDTATVPVGVDVDLAGLGTWSYATTLRLVYDDEEHDRWEVADDPTNVHPDLGPDRRFERVLSWPQRAPVLLADGSTPSANGPWRAAIGATGKATAAQAAALGPYYRVGDTVGVSGLQAVREADLAGTPTTEIRLLEGDAVVSVALSVPGVEPVPVRATWDPRVQGLADGALDAGINRVLTAERKKADEEYKAAVAATPEGTPPPPPPAPPVPRPGAVVVVQPSTGALLAASSRPAGGFPRALQGLYPPGSTGKVITTVALLAGGLGADERVPCPPSANVGGRDFVNAEGEALGDIPFRTAFAHSCNTAFVQLAGRVPNDVLASTAASFGFGAEPGLGFPLAKSSFPEPRSAVERAAQAIGQGRVVATPFQMAMVAAAAAAGGYRSPTLVQGSVATLTPFPPGVAETLQAFMRQVVADGTGTKARLPGAPVAGKTGTAEYGSGDPLPTHAWFIAFRGDIALAVVVEGAGFGGDVAAPIAADLFRRLG